MIEVENLCKDYLVKGSKDGLFSRGKQKKRAVSNINFTIHPGELVGYIGPNGAGKSTTIKMLTGILLPDGAWTRSASANRTAGIWGCCLDSVPSSGGICGWMTPTAC